MAQDFGRPHVATRRTDHSDLELRGHMLNAMAKETQRGWRIVKHRAAAKVDLAVALAMAVKAAEGDIVRPQIDLEGVFQLRRLLRI